MKFKDLEKCIDMFNNEGLSVEDIEGAYIDGFLENQKMMVDIYLKQEKDSACKVSNCDKSGMCWITIYENNKELSTQVSIDELRIALRKLVAR